MNQITNFITLIKDWEPQPLTVVSLIALGAFVLVGGALYIVSLALRQRSKEK